MLTVHGRAKKDLLHVKKDTSSAQNLLDLAYDAGKITTGGKVPKDIIENLDFYTWGGRKRTGNI